MTDFFDFVRSRGDLDIDDDDMEEFKNDCKKRIRIFSFSRGNKTSDQLISTYDGQIVFIQRGFDDRVSLGDTWICLMNVAPNGQLYATPLYKMSPAFLVNLDSNLRDSIIGDLWLRNRKMLENEFAERYKKEISETVTAEMESRYKTTINSLKDRISELETTNQYNHLLLQNTAHSTVETGIELGSEEEFTEGIEMGSEEPCPATVPQIRSAPKIPVTTERAMPGFPELRDLTSIQSGPVDDARYVVERTGENTLFSESFTNLKYLIHISPSFNMLVIRPNEYGTAYGLNRTITLKGLGKISPFKERKTLNAEYSRKYDGLVVYL